MKLTIFISCGIIGVLVLSLVILGFINKGAAFMSIKWTH